MLNKYDFIPVSFADRDPYGELKRLFDLASAGDWELVSTCSPSPGLLLLFWRRPMTLAEEAEFESLREWIKEEKEEDEQLINA